MIGKTNVPAGQDEAKLGATLGGTSALGQLGRISDRPVADELFLISINHRTGRPWLDRRTAGFGLSAGLLAELVLAQWIDIREGAIYVLRRGRPPDDLAGTVHGYLVGRLPRRDVSRWLTFLQPFAIDSVGHRLMRAGLVRSVKRQSLATAAAYLPVDRNVAAMPTIRLGRLLTAASDLAERDAVLAGLVAMTGLSRHLLRSTDDYHAGLAHLSRSVARLRPALQQLGALAESAIGRTPCRVSRS